MCRLTERMVRSTLVTAWFFADWPTRTSPFLAKATTDGVVREPSELAMTVGSPPSRTVTTELVVPRSIPTARAMELASLPCVPGWFSDVWESSTRLARGPLNFPAQTNGSPATCVPGPPASSRPDLRRGRRTCVVTDSGDHAAALEDVVHRPAPPDPRAMSGNEGWRRAPHVAPLGRTAPRSLHRRRRPSSRLPAPGDPPTAHDRTVGPAATWRPHDGRSPRV